MNDIPREKLKYIITQYGRAVIDEPKKVEGLLRDLCPEHKREVNILIAALQERIPTDLLSISAGTPPETVFARLIQRLIDDRALHDDAAHWAVETWALALGLAVPIAQKPTFSQKAQKVGFSPEPAKVTPPPPQARKDEAANTPPVAQIRLRSTPLANLSESNVKAMLKKYDFFCQTYGSSKAFSNPNGKGFASQFEKQAGGQVIFDRASGLMWQQSGSSYMNYENAKKYVAQLNRNRFAGYNDWRLPTLEEGMSLMKPTKLNGNLYIDPLFDSSQPWLWTADNSATSDGISSYASRAWVVDFNFGDCGYFDVDYGIYVRAVR